MPIVIGLSQPLVEYDRKLGYLVAANVPRQLELMVCYGLIEQELNQYPRRFFEIANVKQFVCCSGLLQGDFASLQSAGGLAHIRKEAILLKVSFHRAWMRQAVHHELFHMLDYAMLLGDRDPLWIGLNESSHRYHHRYQLHPSLGDTFSSGFASEYARTSPCEDKAELFAAMMTEYSLIKYRAARDVVLQRKVNCIKQRLATWCPEINEAFWAAIGKRERSQDERSQAETVKLIDHSREAVTIFAYELLPGMGQPLQNWCILIETPVKQLAEQGMSDLSKISIFVGVMLSPCLLILLFGFLTKK